MTLIASIMKGDMVTASADETVTAVAKRMVENGVGAVIVVDGEALVGLFSERDLLRRVVVAGMVPGATSVGEVMTRDPISVDVGVHVKECGRLLRDNGFRHLPVTEGSRPVGILSVRDLLTYVVGGLEDFIDQARYEEELRGGADPYDHLGGGYAR